MNTPRQKRDNSARRNHEPDKSVRARKFVPTQVSGVVSALLKSRKLDVGVRDARIFGAFTAVCGDAVRKHARAVRYRSGELTVAVDSASWRQQLTFLLEDLKQKLNQKLGKDEVHTIRLSHGTPGQQQDASDDAPPEPKLPPATPPQLADADKLSHLVADGELGTLIAHAYLNAKRRGR